MLIVVQILSVIIGLYQAIGKSIKHIFTATFVFNAVCMLMYFLNQDTATAYGYILIVIRSFVYIYKDKLHKHWYLPFLFVAIHITVTLITMDKPSQLIPLCIVCGSCLYLWFSQTLQQLRIGNLIVNAAWGAYNIYTGLYIAVATRAISVIANAAAYLKNSKHKTTQKEN